MKQQIQFVQTKKSDYLEDLVMEGLDTMGEKFDWVIRADVFFKEEKGTYGKGKICEIRLSVPGPRIFASSNEESFEAAIAETIQDLNRQLKKRKDEMYTSFGGKKGRPRLEEMEEGQEELGPEDE